MRLWPRRKTTEEWAAEWAREHPRDERNLPPGWYFDKHGYPQPNFDEYGAPLPRPGTEPQ